MISPKAYMEADRYKKLLKEKADPDICVTELLRCVNATGKPFYAYIRIKPSEYMDYVHKVESGEAINPNHYEIVEYGWGEHPPEHLQQLMEEKYGVDHDAQKKISPSGAKVVEDRIAG